MASSANADMRGMHGPPRPREPASTFLDLLLVMNSKRWHDRLPETTTQANKATAWQTGWTRTSPNPTRIEKCASPAERGTIANYRLEEQAQLMSTDSTEHAGRSCV